MNIMLILIQVSKEWQVIQSYTDSKWPDAESDFTSHNKSRGLKFDQSQHKSMNAELKFLYTALTRARCNLWIYDSDDHKNFPMFDYWSRQNLVRIVNIDHEMRKTEDLREVLSAPSTPEEWEAQGDYFKRKNLWKPAMKCYHNANRPHLELKAKAFVIFKESQSHKGDEMYLRMAHAFLESNQHQQDENCLENAAKCFKKCKMYKESSQLYKLLGQVSHLFISKINM